MKGYRNYRVDLEYIDERGDIQIHTSLERSTTKGAVNAAKKLSASQSFKDLSSQYETVRVWSFSDEGSNDDWVYGTHTFEFQDGVKTYETVG